MSEVIIHLDQFPQAGFSDASIGERFRFVIEGVVFSIEDDLIDSTTIGGPRDYTPGRRTVKLLLTDVHGLTDDPRDKETAA